MRKKVLCLFLAVAISATQLVPVLADREADLRSARRAANSQLETTNSRINSLESQVQALQAEIDQMDAQLVDIMVAIDVLADEITQKEADIEETKAKLAEAEAQRDQQYADMKTRIAYIYENGGSAGWAQLILSEDNLASMLNKAEYTQQLYEYDRESLEKFKQVVQEVTDLGNQLAEEKADLEAMQNEYREQEASLEAALAEKKETSADYENQIAVAEQQAAQYRRLIEQQTAEIAQIEEAKRRAAEEAARKAAEAERARQAAAAEAARAAEAEEEETSTESSRSTEQETESSSSSGSSNSGYQEEEEEEYEEESSSGSSVSYSGTGSSVASYACQFVGNPYVWGGESLTNGADCSGFIKKVYERFGVSLPHSSAAMRSCGTGVPYSQAMPGDIICYSGHVAIYMGGGSIVHASNERDGIKISGNAAYRTILSVRRVI